MIPAGRFWVEAADGRFNIHVGPDDVDMECQEIPEENRHQLARFFMAHLALLSDSPLERKPKAVLRAHKKMLLKVPLKTLAKQYSTLADEWLRNCHLYGSRPETGEYLPAFEKTPIYREYKAWRDSQDPKIARFILTWLWFGKKVPITDERLLTTALRGWEEVETRLSELVLPDYPLRRVYDKFFGPAPRMVFQGRHGPGAVAETRKGVSGALAKSVNLQSHPRLAYLFMRLGNLREDLNYTGKEFMLGERLSTSWRGSDMLKPQNRRVHKSLDTAQVRFVEKNLWTMRTICMEPTAFMYAQQHVRAMLEELIASSPLSPYIVIHDQSVNRDAAREGSIAGFIDTTDLKWASDSVHIDLVRKLFEPGMLLHLLATRTHRVVLPDGRGMDVKKFAPMGSACCFPTQCIIFACIAMYACLEWHSQRHGLSIDELLLEDGPRLVRRMFHVRHGGCRTTGFHKLEPIAIYGDDICCDTRVTQRLVDLLSEHGFTVNASKSFEGAQSFRESCGGYYLSGEDVTPLFYRVKNTGEELTANALASLCASADLAGDHGYKNLHRLYIQMALLTPIAGINKPPGTKNWLMFSSVRGRGIYHPAPQNGHLPHKREHPRYQRASAKVLTFRYKNRVGVKSYRHDWYRHRQWWVLNAQTDNTPEFVGRFAWEGRNLSIQHVWSLLDQ